MPAKTEKLKIKKNPKAKKKTIRKNEK